MRPLYIDNAHGDPFDSARTLERPGLSPRAAMRIIRRDDLGPQPMPLVRRAPSSNNTEEVDLDDVLEAAEVLAPTPRRKVSVNATQELSAEDVLEATNAQVDSEVDAFVDAHERPYVVDTSELRVDRSRLTVLSTSDIQRRQRRGGIIVGATVGFGLAVMALAALTQLVPMSGAELIAPATPLLGRSASNDLRWHEQLRAQKPRAAARPVSDGNELIFSVDALPKSRRR